MRFGTKTLTDIRGIWATGCSIRQQVLPMVWLMALLFAGSTAVPVCAADESPLAQAIMAASAEHPATSGLLLVDTGSEALSERDALIDAAVRTIDAQY